jgi:uncharacterized protein (DUF1800 family)
MVTGDIGLIAHLMKRAGFGADREELERRCQIGYEETVEELLDPKNSDIPAFDPDTLYRHHPAMENPGGNPLNGQAEWMYRIINTPRPLEEKMALFWHHVFATGNSKVDHCAVVMKQVDLFRSFGLGSYKDLLLMVSKDPAMIFWLDNNQNHKDAPNENWGRELLELFSMGQGNYTELDVKETARAFTGWTIEPSLPRMPFQRYLWNFMYLEEDHDNGEKIFLGYRGNFNGEDIIDIICRQPATARFIARHLYNFFVEDEVQVPSWLDIPPKDNVAINILSEALFNSGYDIQKTLRVLFNSAFFKNPKIWNSKVKSPAELVASTMRLIDAHRSPRPGIGVIGLEPGYQGQALLDPPSVEGWHTGKEWIDSGALLRRINFVADRIGDISNPGVKRIVDRISQITNLSPEQLVDQCVELVGPIRLEDKTRTELIEHAQAGRNSQNVSTESASILEDRNSTICEMLQLIASTREYQFC